MGQSQSQQCGICERTTLFGVFSEDNFLKCHRCDGVYCMECAGLSSNQFDQITKSEGAIQWYCVHCVIAIKRRCDVETVN
ncbi:hypothetical protein HDE_13930 [Halotydeus destructor]|nr:hypothetical protein HDE_13930 [Halotydeus destructor]